MTFPGQTDGANVLDDEVLDEYLIPFGSWVEETVDWTTLNLSGVLDAIAWPFEFLLENIVDRFLLSIPWLVVVAIMFAVAWLVRNLTVATGTALGLTVCGLLGDDFWVQTARTIGFIVVAVIVCVVIGIPLGIVSGRVDGVWRVMRPTLDAMQVIHAFVYLLPFVYFWGVGRISATMATMVFALPPLIRLTNLGIRGVPEDVVEASRAYGASEWRVLRDVQLPLARPAIMTGINQTLLLAFSMLGIAAILGAGGLGALLFRALGQQDVNLAAAAGLGFFLLAVILDRISQTEVGTRNLFSRITAAWRARATPEDLLGDPDFDPTAQPTDPEPDNDGAPAPLTARERSAIALVAAGSSAAIVSIGLDWAVDGAPISAYARMDDAGLLGSSFSGLSASGGSWFGIVLAFCAIVAIAAALSVLTGRRAARWLSADGAAISAVAGLVTVLAFVLARASALSPDHRIGLGAWMALAGTGVAAAAAAVWCGSAPYAPRRPLRRRIRAGSLWLVTLALGVAVMSLFSMWHLDERGGILMTPEIQAEIDELREQAAAGLIDPGVAATEIQVIRAKAERSDRVISDGMASDGTGLGRVVVVLAALGAIGATVAAGVGRRGDRGRWLGGVAAMGAGLGILGLAVGFVGSIARVADRNYVSGVGALLAAIAGVLLMAAGNAVVRGFERTKVYRVAEPSPDPSPSTVTSVVVDGETQEVVV